MRTISTGGQSAGTARGALQAIHGLCSSHSEILARYQSAGTVVDCERARMLKNCYLVPNRRLGGAVRHFVRNTPPAAVKSVCNLTAIYGLLK